MAKLNADFFTDNEVLFIGYSSRNQAYSKEIFRAFANNGIKVFPMNNKESASFDIKVYKSISELPKVPKCAYILLNKDRASGIIQELSDHGVKKILFHNKKIASPQALDKCKELGIETSVACPLMMFGKGIHKLHGRFAGVR